LLPFSTEDLGLQQLVDFINFEAFPTKKTGQFFTPTPRPATEATSKHEEMGGLKKRNPLPKQRP